MKFNIRHKMNMSQFGRLARRFTALSLVFAMSLPTMAFAVEEGPAPAEYVVPTITIEANAVVDRWYDPKSSAMDVRDYLTGDLEVAIRVQTGKLSEEQKKLGFNSLGVALKYSPLLTPYKWTLIDGIDLSGKDLSDWTAEERTNYKKDAAQPVDLTTTQQPFEQLANMQTLKSKQITTAVGQVSGEEGKGGYLYMLAQSDRPIELVEDTVLAVVTFRYDLSKYQIVAAEAEKWLTPSVVTPPAGGAETVGEENGGETNQTEGDYDCLLQFASYTDLAGRYMGCELTYNPANGLMYYTGDANNPAIPAPEAGKALELEDPTTSKYQGAPTEGKINFRLVNHTTYNDGGLSLDDLASVLFYDWDDTLIGVLIVPRDGDARKLVNDYVRENLVHPDLRVVEPQNDPTWVSHVDSLSREYNYRGKYPSTPMVEGGEDDTMDSRRTDGLKGADYPLTNKLDYVFLKRPMEKVTEDENGDPITTNTWRQKGTSAESLENEEWDECFIYTHGWARLTDENWNNPSSMWTTIGIGELAEYTGVTSGAYAIDPETGDVIVNHDGSELTVDDVDFQFETFDFRKHPLEAGGVCSVKAVYEPGADLLNTNYTYHMISEPYYDKMNAPSAALGGAYSVNVLYERANKNAFDQTLRGVGRARKLELRQETTSDIRWEDSNLSNATNDEQLAKGKTTYSTLSVDNIEEVQIQLVLSGRQNKVDYFLMEANGASFVTGGERSDTNTGRAGSAHIMDNYNYNTPDNNMDRMYYRAEYGDTDGDGVVNDDRSGTYGFVLFGTINNLANNVRNYFNGSITQQSLNNFLSLNNFTDMNLRAGGTMTNGSLTGGAVVAVGTRTAVRNAWQAIVYTAIAAHEGTDGYSSTNNEWWNVEHDCPQLTYHQIQLFIHEYEKKYGKESQVGTDSAHMADYRTWLRDSETADGITISWCNLHEECAASRSGKPTSFARMVKVVLEKTEEEAKAAISLLTLTEAEALSHIRADKRGSAYASIDQLADAFIKAVKGINAIDPLDPGALTEDDWDAIQGWILVDSKPTNTTTLAETIQLSRDTAWWNQGESAPGAGSLQDLLNAAQKALDTGRDAWINYYRYQEYFEDMKTNGITPESWWTLLTENLVKNIDGDPFDDYNQFRTAIKMAVDDLGTEATWDQIQYYVAGDTRTPVEDAYATYWWHYGYSKVTNLATLFVAAQQYLAGSTTVWDMFSLEDLYGEDGLKELHFRSEFNGTTGVYTQANIADFKAGILAFIQANGAIIATTDSTTAQRNNSWNQLQYYLIHKDDPGGCDLEDRNTSLGLQKESAYYWWKDAGEGTAYSLAPGSGDSNLTTLMEAVYRHYYNGNPHALDQLDDAAAALYRLIPTYAGTEENWDALTKYGDTAHPVTELIQGLDNLANAAGEADCRSLVWRQIQHFLLGGGYIADLTDSRLPTDNPTDKDDADGKNYWWRTGEQNPNTATEIKTDLDVFLEIIDQYNAGTYEGDFEEAIDLYSGISGGAAGGRLNLYGGTSPRAAKPLGSCTTAQKKTFRTKIINIAAKLKEDGVSAAEKLDWFVLQWYAMNANKYAVGTEIKDKASAKDYYENTLLPQSGKPNWAPSYVEVQIVAANLMLLEPEIVDLWDLLTPEEKVAQLAERVYDLMDAIREDPTLAEEYAEELQQLIEALEELKALLAPTETPEPTESPELTETPAPTESPEPAETPAPTESPEPVETPEPTESPEPAETSEPTESPEPTETPDPSESLGPVENPEPTEPEGPDASAEPSDFGENDIGKDTAVTRARTFQARAAAVNTSRLITTSRTKSLLSNRLPLPTALLITEVDPLLETGRERLFWSPLLQKAGAPPGRLLYRPKLPDRGNILTIGRTPT